MLGALRHSFPPTIRQLLSSSASKSVSAANGKQIEICGWVKSVRRQKNVSFAVVSDGSSTSGLQAVFRSDVVPEKLSNGCTVRLRGSLVESRGAKQDMEFQVAAAEVVGECNPDTYPIQKQALTTDYLRDQCHLRARVDMLGLMLRIRDSLTRGAHTYFESMGFMHVHAPIITASDCEGAGEAFSVSASSPTTASPTSPPSTHSESTKEPHEDHFFRTPAFLTVSSQLHLEALAHARSRVYTLGPSFRAERSQTGRHLAEFWMLEAEWGFVDTVGELCDVVEDLVREMVGRVLKDEYSPPTQRQNREGEEREANEDMKKRVAETFALERGRWWTRLTYEDAIKLLRESGAKWEFEPSWEGGLQSEHEKWLAAHFAGPVFVTHYPASQKPFYMRLSSPSSPSSSSAEERKTVECFDLLVPGIGELVGGSLREERLDLLDKAMKMHSLDGKEEYEWYRDLRRFGGSPHGGFGLGLERLVSAVSGQPNVRECIPMPRWAGRMLL